MDQPRGRPTGGRARGRGDGGAPQQQRQQQPRGPPQQFQAAPPPPQGAWANRGRGNVAAGAAASGPPPSGPPMESVTQRVGAMSLAASGSTSGRGVTPSDSGRTRGEGDTGGRGAIRQRPVEEVVFRPAYLTDKQGSKGDPISLMANYFRLSKKVDMTVCLYRVDFNPDLEVTSIRKGLLKPHQERFGKYIFDGTVLYTRVRFDEIQVVSRTQRDDTPVQITIRPTTDLVPGDPNYTDFMNLILRKAMGMMNLELMGRDYFDPKAKIDLQQYNIEVWPGFKTSIRQCEDELLLNVEVCSKIVRLETAYAFMQETKREARQDWKEIFMNAIIGTVVLTRYNNKSYRVDDVDFGSNPNSSFELRNHGRITYREYYRKKYQIDIKYEDQPLLISNPTKREVRQKGAKATSVYLVPETCCLTGLTDRMRANRTLMTALADHTKIPPGKRVERIQEDFMKRLLANHKEVSTELNNWNLNFEKTVVKFSGRVLNPENIIVGNGQSFPINRKTGDFTRGLIDCKAPFLNCQPLLNWAVVYPRKISDRDVLSFCRTIHKAASTFRFQIAEPHMEAINDDRGNSYAAAVEACLANKVSLVMCVVPNDRKDRYDAIKRKCYIQRSIPNQVVLMKNVSKNNMSVATKIAIQMSCKIGGSPWAINIPLKGTMIVGFDVCHDTTNKMQSHGALVATIDDRFTRYASFVNPHEAHTELSNYMGSNMLKAISMFREVNNGQIPAKIIFYRDGVGEGNLHHTKEHEVGSICATLAQLYGGKEKVPITFIVVSKRINTRIFAGNANPPPGTVVDSCVTLPVWYDFFLVSQSVTAGTVAPTSYNVLYDANNLKPDVAQQLSYRLCHLYYNWSGALRVPAPCQYAHKLAFLVGQHLHAPPSEGMNSFLYFL